MQLLVVKKLLYLVVIGKTSNVKKRCHFPVARRIPPDAYLSKHARWLQVSPPFTHSYPREARSVLMSAATSRQRVCGAPTVTV